MNAQLREALAALTNEAKRANKTALREFGVGLIDVNVIARADAALSAPAEQAPVDDSMEDPVLVPRGLLGAACFAIEKKRDAPTILAKLRAITMSAASTSAPTTVQPADDALTHSERAACQQCGSDPHKMSCSVGGKTQLRLTADATPTAVKEVGGVEPTGLSYHLNKIIQTTREIERGIYSSRCEDIRESTRLIAELARAYGGVADLRDAKWLDPRCAARGACQSLVFAQGVATPVAPPDLRERLAEAHDASLDEDHRACRDILTETMRLLDATPVAPKTLEALTLKEVEQAAEPFRAQISSEGEIKPAIRYHYVYEFAVELQRRFAAKNNMTLGGE